MKLQCWFLSTIFASALAAPAVVWKQSKTSEQKSIHNSDDYPAQRLLKDVLSAERKESSLAAVVFLVAKGNDGSESFTELATNGKLPQTAGKYDDAEVIHHQVSGIETTKTMVRDATRANTEHKVMHATLGELNSKLTSLSVPTEVELEVAGDGQLLSKKSKAANKRAQTAAESNVFIVEVDPKDAAQLDETVVKCIDNEKVENVIVAGIRSLGEVKRERTILAKRRMEVMETEGHRVLASQRRRLGEEEDGDVGDDAVQEDADMEGVYYVHMTPNIFAGLLFTVLFLMITFIGISCMGAIAGQEVYVSKMPTIGREV